uniref:Ribonuclease H-like domain, reverse transcriptase, RNA-dependent DNA polymerase n=1 Tax=Tanacetum cinerariifolium TaxID=118510 RepID=A0A6L2LFQ6_TANCI|nr:ribonuclease H-like domain, reverse transcriptase, RNA-dependent DNA polymerase [Tanacetum cinerariifolium]
MAPLTFADTHNMIAFLTKSDASKGIDQMVDFLTAHTIQYALMVNPPIYVSYDADGVECLPNEEIFAELARMRYEKPPPKLTFYKAFFSAQWKFLIHMIFQCMSAKRTAWNEFSSSMASVVICLATGRKFNDTLRLPGFRILLDTLLPVSNLKTFLLGRGKVIRTTRLLSELIQIRTG